MALTRRVAGNWRAYVACWGLGLACLIACEAQRSSYAQGPGQTQTNSPESGSPTSLGRSTLDYKHTCSKTQSETDANLCISRESLKAYKKQAYWAEATFFIGASGTAAILATLVWTVRAVKAAERSANAAFKQAKVAEDAFIGLERPFVWPDEIKVWLSPERQVDISSELAPGNVWASARFQNHGRTPAIIQDVRLSISVGSFPEGCRAEGPNLVTAEIVTQPNSEEPLRFVAQKRMQVTFGHDFREPPFVFLHCVVVYADAFEATFVRLYTARVTPEKRIMPLSGAIYCNERRYPPGEYERSGPKMA